MDSNYTRIYIGNPIEAQDITACLAKVGIDAILKNEKESARLAGFGTTSQSNVEIFVHQDELAKSQEALKD